MGIRVAIMGFGRMGRNIFRAVYLRDDIEIVFEFPAPYYLQITRKALFEPLQWGLWDNVDPVLTVTHDNVVLTSLYVWSESDELVPSGDQ